MTLFNSLLLSFCSIAGSLSTVFLATALSQYIMVRLNNVTSVILGNLSNLLFPSTFYIIKEYTRVLRGLPSQRLPWGRLLPRLLQRRRQQDTRRKLPRSQMRLKNRMLPRPFPRREHRSSRRKLGQRLRLRRMS